MIEHTLASIQQYIKDSGQYWCPFSRRFIRPGYDDCIIIDSIQMMPSTPDSLSKSKLVAELIKKLVDKSL